MYSLIFNYLSIIWIIFSTGNVCLQTIVCTDFFFLFKLWCLSLIIRGLKYCQTKLWKFTFIGKSKYTSPKIKDQAFMVCLCFVGRLDALSRQNGINSFLLSSKVKFFMEISKTFLYKGFNMTTASFAFYTNYGHNLLLVCSYTLN